MTVRIAMWSGPRNLSTAMMRSWENRGDCTVTDEPLYACYLARTGLQHPGADEVMASQSTDWRAVTTWLTGDAPGGAAVWYQKHMTHHLLPEMDRGWLAAIHHCFLIREPQLVAASYAKTRSQVTLSDLGYEQQAEIFRYLTRTQGTPPSVISSADLLANPRAMLTALCAKLGVDFRESMLSWPPGPRPSDGVWAKYWYHSVEHSTGFATNRSAATALSPQLEAIAAAAEPFYRELYTHRLRPAATIDPQQSSAAP